MAPLKAVHFISFRELRTFIQYCKKVNNYQDNIDLYFSVSVCIDLYMQTCRITNT